MRRDMPQPVERRPQAACDAESQSRQENRQCGGRGHRGQHREPHRHYQIRKRNDGGARSREFRALPGLARVQQGRGGARHQAAQQAEYQQAPPHADKTQRDVTCQVQAGDQHHHQPHMVRIERAVRSIAFVRKQRHHDECQHRELQYHADVVRRELFREPVQLSLEMQQHGGCDCHGHCNLAVPVPHHRAQAVTQDHGDHGGGAGIRVGVPVLRVGGYDHRAGEQQAHGQQPWRPGHTGEQAGARPEHGHQHTGAQTRLGCRIALALEADQQANAEARQKLQHDLQFRTGQT